MASSLPIGGGGVFCGWGLAGVGGCANSSGMKTKRDRCPTCSPDSNHAIWEAVTVFDADACERIPMWECRCCHGRKPRRVVRRPSAIAALLASGEECTLEAALAALRADRR